MIDLSLSEMLLIAVVAIVVIGPKDLPHVLAKVGRWVGQGKAMVRQLRHGFDEMVRESELQEMEKRWAEHNRRIMEEHPNVTEPHDADAFTDDKPQMRPLPPPAAHSDDDSLIRQPELKLDVEPDVPKPADDKQIDVGAGDGANGKDGRQ